MTSNHNNHWGACGQPFNRGVSARWYRGGPSYVSLLRTRGSIERGVKKKKLSARSLLPSTAVITLRFSTAQTSGRCHEEIPTQSLDGYDFSHEEFRCSPPLALVHPVEQGAGKNISRALRERALCVCHEPTRYHCLPDFQQAINTFVNLRPHFCKPPDNPNW